MLSSFLIGSAVGSFLNVCIDRIPRGESLLHPASHCENCGRELAVLDLIPIASYLLLRAHCRTCRALIPARVFLVELGTGLLFALIQNRCGASPQGLLVAVFSAILIVLLGIDLEHHTVPNSITYPAIAIAAFSAPSILGVNLGSMLSGGAFGLVLLVLIGLAYPGGMGMGDAKLAAFIGLAVGFPKVLLALLISFIIGGMVAGALLIAQRIRRDEPIAFAPFLAAGAITTLLYGQEILNFWQGGL